MPAVAPPRPLSRADVEALVRRRAPARGLDPEAVLAVGAVEGLGGGIGDNGTSFGGWQLHEGGALPARFNGNPKAAHAWAWSAPGVEYALDRMDDVAAGLTGDKAIDAIVRKFERPADPSTEVAKAAGFYGGGGGGGVAAAPFPPALPGTAAGPNIGAFTQALIGQIGKKPDMLGLLGALKQPGAAPGPAVAPPVVGNAGDAGGVTSGGGLDDLFYTPLGYSIDEGKPWGKTISGHGGHGHASWDNPAAALAAMKEAQRRGLAIRENPLYDHVDPVHTKNSDHYAVFEDDPRTKMNEATVGRAADFSGDPKVLKAFMAWLASGAAH